jgi:hypothetical protein
MVVIHSEMVYPWFSLIVTFAFPFREALYLDMTDRCKTAVLSFNKFAFTLVIRFLLDAIDANLLDHL